MTFARSLARPDPRPTHTSPCHLIGRRLGCVAFLAALLLVAPFPAAGVADEKPLAATDAAQHYGLAAAAAEFCPAGKLTGKAKALADAYTGDEAALFKAEVEKIREAWKSGTACDAAAMDTPQLSMCRTMHLRSCRAAWGQVGPGGRTMPDLIDTDLSKIE
jgi:hypothetical protein